MKIHPKDKVLKVAIVDSHGFEAIHPLYKETLSHCTFHGITPPNLRGEPLHGHGGWCAWDWASQSTQPLEILFIRVFNQDGVKQASEDFEFKALKDFKPDYINYSSGATRGNRFQEASLKIFYGPEWQEPWFDSIGDALVVMSAGNSSRYQYSYPQKLLVAQPQVKIIAACKADGYVAPFSSTDTWNERYVDSAYLGQNCKSLDARTGKVVTWNGTSSSCPHAGGDLCAKRIVDGAGADEYWTELGGKGGEYNAEVGLGVCEGGRQANMIRTGLGLGAIRTRGHGIMSRFEDQPMYHDFERLT
jgi:hypothetical protein